MLNEELRTAFSYINYNAPERTLLKSSDSVKSVKPEGVIQSNVRDDMQFIKSSHFSWLEARLWLDVARRPISSSVNIVSQ